MVEGFPYTLTSEEEPLLSQPGPLLLNGWRYWLRSHPDPIFAKTIGLVITRDIKVGYRDPQQLLFNRAYRSTAIAPQVLSEDIQKQL